MTDSRHTVGAISSWVNLLVLLADSEDATRLVNLLVKSINLRGNKLLLMVKSVNLRGESLVLTVKSIN